jgi:hypothetical protein
MPELIWMIKGEIGNGMGSLYDLITRIEVLSCDGNQLGFV